MKTKYVSRLKALPVCDHSSKCTGLQNYSSGRTKAKEWGRKKHNEPEDC